MRTLLEMPTARRRKAATPWYESNLLWGPLALGVGVVLTVLAAMLHDLRWLLWLAFPCFCVSAWSLARRSKHAIWIMLLTVIALSLGTFIGFKKLQPKSEPRQPTNESTTVTTTQSTATQTKKSQSRAAAQKNGSLPTESSGTASTATDSGSAAPYPGDSCIDYDAGSLYVAPHSPGYVIKNDIVTIPITFESETKALALLRESRAHTGLCTEPNLNDDLSRGFDTFVVWKGSASDSSLNNLILPFPSCSFPPALTFEREYEQGPFYLADNGKAVLKFDSASKATRALTLFNSAMGGLIFSGELCTIGISDSQEVGSEKHPVIAYKEH